MQAPVAETVTEINGPILVEAKRGSTSIERVGQMAGFYVRKRMPGDQFNIASWDDFSPRWMKAITPIPEKERAKIETRASRLGVEVDGVDEVTAPVQDPYKPRALGETQTPVDSNSFNFSSGKMKLNPNRMQRKA